MIKSSFSTILYSIADELETGITILHGTYVEDVVHIKISACNRFIIHTLRQTLFRQDT